MLNSKLIQRTKGSDIRAKEIFKILISVISCSISSASTLIGFLSPVNVAIIAISGNLSAIAGFTASIITYLLTGNFLRGLVQICSMALLTAYKFFKADDEDTDNSVFLALMSFGLMAIFGVGLGLLLEEDAYELIFRLTSAVMCGVTVFFALTVKTAYKTQGSFSMTEKNGASIGVLYVLTVATLTSVNIAGFNIGRITGIIIVLIAAQRYRLTGGAIVGALTSCGVILCSSELAANTVLLATAGMLCGICSGMGSFIITVVFMLVNLVGLLTVGINLDTSNILADAMIASVTFLLIPQKASNRITQIIGIATASDITAGNTSSRLVFASKTIQEIKSQLLRITNAVELKSDVADYSDMVCQGVCSKCPSNLECWNRYFEQTNAAFNSFSKILDNTGVITSKDMSERLSWCTFKSTVMNEFNYCYKMTNYERNQTMKNTYAKEIVNEQLSVMECILDDLGADAQLYYIPQKSKTNILKKYIYKLGAANFKACVFKDENGKQVVEIFLPKDFKTDDVKLCSDISEITECELALPTSTVVKNLRKLVFAEKAAYRIENEIYCITSSKSETSGDTVQREELSPNEDVIILSDGMGTGRQARLDSMMAVSFALRMLRAGIRPSTALRLLNSVLTVKVWDESFATIDIAYFNRKNAKLELVKAGAASTYIITDSDTLKVNEQSFPLGILSEFYPSQKSFSLKKGDVVLMMTDGVTEVLASKLVLETRKNRNKSVKEISRMLGDICNSEMQQEHDDITLVVFKVFEDD